MAHTDEFINKYGSVAVRDSIVSGVPASITLAQAILESGWGNSTLTTEANNFFGIKAHGWDGATYNIATQEYGSGGYYTIQSDFRAYSSPYESFSDHSKFLKDNSRYHSLFTLNPKDYRSWANGLQQAGYATAPDYASKLINLIETYNLDRFDEQTENKRILIQIAWIFFFVMLAIVGYKLIKRFLFRS